MWLNSRSARRELLTGFALDLCFGDPQYLPHPVRAIGFLAKLSEGFWRYSNLPLRLSGALFWLTVVGTTATAVRLTEPWGNVYWIYSLLACRDLDKQAFAAVVPLRAGDLSAARKRLAWIVGRDTEHLSEAEVYRAVIETMAENCSDGVLAPLLYLALAGPSGMALYKAANTLDSIVGYRNERYRDFGWCSARVDDILNFVPARINAVVTSMVAMLPDYSARNAIRITLRDGSSQPSPNAGFPEAAFAGALQVQLGGLNHYSGIPSRKQFLGDPIQRLDFASYQRARVLLYCSATLFVAVLCCWRARR